MPVGISFFTFQSLSYTIDVYRRDLKPLDNLLDYVFDEEVRQFLLKNEIAFEEQI